LGSLHQSGNSSSLNDENLSLSLGLGFFWTVMVKIGA
jgi:hypothetical protein